MASKQDTFCPVLSWALSLRKMVSRKRPKVVRYSELAHRMCENETISSSTWRTHERYNFLKAVCIFLGVVPKKEQDIVGGGMTIVNSFNERPLSIE